MMEIFKLIKPDFKKAMTESGFSSVEVVYQITREPNSILLQEREERDETCKN